MKILYTLILIVLYGLSIRLLLMANKERLRIKDHPLKNRIKKIDWKRSGQDKDDRNVKTYQEYCFLQECIFRKDAFSWILFTVFVAMLVSISFTIFFPSIPGQYRVDTHFAFLDGAIRESYVYADSWMEVFWHGLLFYIGLPCYIIGAPWIAYALLKRRADKFCKLIEIAPSKIEEPKQAALPLTAYEVLQPELENRGFDPDVAYKLFAACQKRYGEDKITKAQVRKAAEAATEFTFTLDGELYWKMYRIVRDAVFEARRFDEIRPELERGGFDAALACNLYKACQKVYGDGELTKAQVREVAEDTAAFQTTLAGGLYWKMYRTVRDLIREAAKEP